MERQSFQDEIGVFEPIAAQMAMALHQVRRRQRGGVVAPARPLIESRRPLSAQEVIRVGDVQELSEDDIAQAAAQRAAVTREEGDGRVHTTPISLRGEVIGALSVREDTQQILGPDDLGLIESVADQVAQAIENLNLLRSTESLALRQQLVNDMVAELQRSTSVEEVLRTAVRSLHNALAGYDIVLRLAPSVVAASPQRVAPEASSDDNEDSSERMTG
jgi:GAF domain-containing protein